MYTATGRRKRSSARVTLVSPGTGRIIVNKRVFENYFPRENHRIVIQQPLKFMKLEGKYDVRVNVRGGGATGQAEATRHGIARAILKIDETLKPVVKKAGFLTRDPREKERKKYGRKRARRRFQYSKR
ncbi:MAG: 30S ribosomal protein S9 [Candidatus Omnitrophota bacterium]